MNNLLVRFLLLAALCGLAKATGCCLGQLFCKSKIEDPYGLDEINQLLKGVLDSNEVKSNTEVMSRMLDAVKSRPDKKALASKLTALIGLIGKLSRAKCGSEMSALVAEMERQIPIEYESENRVQEVIFEAMQAVALDCVQKLKTQSLEVTDKKLDKQLSVCLFRDVKASYLAFKQEVHSYTTIKMDPKFFKNYSKYHLKYKFIDDGNIDDFFSMINNDNLIYLNKKGKFEVDFDKIPRLVEDRIVSKCQDWVDDSFERDVLRPATDILATFYANGILTRYVGDYDVDLRFMIESAKYSVCKVIIAEKGKTIASDLKRYLRNKSQFNLNYLMIK